MRDLILKWLGIRLTERRVDRIEHDVAVLDREVRHLREVIKILHAELENARR